MYCSNCGKENPDDGRFCFNCGAQLLSHRTNSVQNNYKMPLTPQSFSSQSHLCANEKDEILVICKHHWIKYVAPIIFTTYFTIAAFLKILVGDFGLGFILLIVAAFLMVDIYAIASASLKLTRIHIIGKVGLIRTKKLMSPTSKIQDVKISQTFLGKIFGYSTVIISTAGTGLSEYVFKCVTNGDELQKKFVEIIQGNEYIW